MSAAVLGIDIAKEKCDIAFLSDGKTKHKSWKNFMEGFETLKLWLEKQRIQKVHACLEVTGNYGNADVLEWLARDLHNKLQRTDFR